MVMPCAAYTAGYSAQSPMPCAKRWFCWFPLIESWLRRWLPFRTNGYSNYGERWLKSTTPSNVLALMWCQLAWKLQNKPLLQLLPLLLLKSYQSLSFCLKKGIFADVSGRIQLALFYCICRDVRASFRNEITLLLLGLLLSQREGCSSGACLMVLQKDEWNCLKQSWGWAPSWFKRPHIAIGPCHSHETNWDPCDIFCLSFFKLQKICLFPEQKCNLNCQRWSCL